MHYYVKEWPNMTATLVTEDGHDLTTFSSLEEAVKACRTWCNVNPLRIEKYSSNVTTSHTNTESN